MNLKVKKLENDKPLRFEGKVWEDGSDKFRAEGYVLGLDERVGELLEAPIENLTNEMERRSNNTKGLLDAFKQELLGDAAKLIIDLKNEIEALRRKILELESLKSEIAEMKKPKSSMPLRFSDFAELHRQKNQEV